MTNTSHYRDIESIHLAHLFSSRFAGSSVLDVGCGKGGNFPLLKAAGCSITGIDANPRQVEELREQGFDVHDISFTPEKESQDVILVSHVIEHMCPEELRSFMDRYIAALKPGGKLVIITPVAGERFWYDCTHVRPYYPQSLRMMFGGLDTAISGTSRWRMVLEDIWFFRDPFRLRMCRAFYPCASPGILERSCLSFVNRTFNSLFRISRGRVGRIASWLGIYGKTS